MTMMSIELTGAKQFLDGLCNGTEQGAVLCAVSGGLDSMCLLHLLSTWGRERNLKVTAAHFNHQLRGAASDRDEAFVRDWCMAHEVDFVAGRGDVRGLAAQNGFTLEEAARTLRYAFLEEQRAQLGCGFILTAHHADDNAETMLLNLIRGTGARGLSGIPAIREQIARPFLQETRETLAAYAAANGISHVEDASNEEDVFARNVLRHKVLPVLRELNPRAVEHMTCAADLLDRDDAALNHLAEQMLQKSSRTDGETLFLHVETCLAAEDAVLSRAVHQALAQIAGHRKDLTAAHVEAVCRLLRGEKGKEQSLPYGVCARREANELAIWQKSSSPEEIAISVGETIQFGSWTVTLSAKEGDYKLYVPADAALCVTVWRRDDRMILPGSRGERSLKRLCAENEILPAQRDLLPILRVNGQAAVAPGVGVHLDFTQQEHTPVIFITFHQEKEFEEKRYEK